MISVANVLCEAMGGYLYSIKYENFDSILLIFYIVYFIQLVKIKYIIHNNKIYYRLQKNLIFQNCENGYQATSEWVYLLVFTWQYVAQETHFLS